MGGGGGSRVDDFRLTRISDDGRFFFDPFVFSCCVFSRCNNFCCA